LAGLLEEQFLGKVNSFKKTSAKTMKKFKEDKIKRKANNNKMKVYKAYLIKFKVLKMDFLSLDL